jgi:outer membrane protein OmpU
MRKLLLGTTALAAAATLSANAALADVSISAATEWHYINHGSQDATLDGDKFSQDSEIAFKFSNKTDSGLTIGYTVELESDTGAGGAGLIIDESSFSISGGFGTIMLGQNDGVATAYAIEAEDATAEESAGSVASATIRFDTDISLDETDNNKIAYTLPAMGGFKAGISFEDSGAGSGSANKADVTAVGASFTTEAAGSTITIGAATVTKEQSGSTPDKDAQNIGVKIASGAATFYLAQSVNEESDEDITAQGFGASYNLGNGITLAGFSMTAEDDLDAGEEYTANSVEASYSIASGLAAVLNVTNYDYKAGTNNDKTESSDDGTITKLVIKASF